MTKVCKKCLTEKSDDSFYRVRKDKVTTRNICKNCDSLSANIRSTKNYHKNKTIFRKSNLKRKYNITLDYYEYLLKLQNYKCYVCGITEQELGKHFSVDHDHSTLKVRGLLCNNCNTALGLLNDDQGRISKLLEYLKNNK